MPQINESMHSKGRVALFTSILFLPSLPSLPSLFLSLSLLFFSFNLYQLFHQLAVIDPSISISVVN